MNPQDPIQIESIEEKLKELPDSVKKVWAVLKPDKWLTGKELREITKLPRRTIHEALRRLKEKDLMKERGSLEDSRQSNFRRKTEEGKAKVEIPAETVAVQAIQRKRPVSIFDVLLAESANKSVASLAPTKPSRENEPEQTLPSSGLSRQTEKIWNTIQKADKAVDEDYLQKESGLPMSAVKIALESLMKHSLVEKAYSLEDGITIIYRLKKPRRQA